MKGFHVIFVVLILASLSACKRDKGPNALRGRQGGLTESLTTQSAFEEIRGAHDMRRVPFWFPVHLVWTLDSWSLCEGTSVTLDGIVEIGWKTNVVYGRCTGISQFGRKGLNGWFSLGTEEANVSMFTNQVEWRRSLAAHGVEEVILQEPNFAWGAFWTVRGGIRSIPVLVTNPPGR